MKSQQPTPAPKAVMGKPIRILNVDDSSDFRALVKEVLEKESRGFKVTEAASRSEFESRLAEGEYDLVLSDFHMQDFLGLHVLDAIQAKDSGVPVVIFSGTGSEASAVECMKRGATDYVIKSPEQMQQLPQTIRAAIEKQRLTEERSQMLGALRESEERYRGLFENAHDLIYMHDLAGNFTSFNQTAEQLSGYARDKALRMNVADLVAPEHLERARAMIDRKLAGEDATTYLVEIISKNGDRIPLEVATKLIYRLGKPVGVQGIGRDITERQRADATLRKTEELYRQAISAAGAVPYSRDYKTDAYTFMGQGIEQMTGYTAQEMTPKHWNQISLQVVMRGEAAGLTLEEAIQRARAGEFKRWQSDGLYLAGNGVKRWIADTSVEVLGDTGQPIGSIGILQDITERKEAERELLRLATAVEQSTESVIITDLHGAIQYVNPACERITGFSRQELISQPFDFILKGKDVPFSFAEITERIRSAGVWTGRFSSRKKDNTPFAEEASISPIRNADGQIINYIAINRDVTREMALEEQVRLAHKMEAIGLLAGGVAHDFNNILQVIQGFTTLAMDDINTPEERNSHLEQVTQAAERASQLTRQLLAFGRRQPLQRADTDLNQVVSEQLNMIQRLIGAHIEVHFVPVPEIENVRADRSQMEQVLLNLCVNSRDAMSKGGRIEIQLENVLITDDFLANHAWARRGHYVRLTVTDTGEGMDRETVTRIFEPFFTTKAKDKGTGLGLAMVYGIVKQHEGMVQVESEPGAGTTFHIYLPVAERVAAGEGHKTAITPARGTETILLAEDEPQVRALAVRTLERVGYRVIAAANGEEAVKLFKENTQGIDLLIFDVVMPKMGGREAHDQIKILKPGIPVLFCSGYSGTTLMAGFELAPDVYLLQKPYTADALLHGIRDLLGVVKG